MQSGCEGIPGWGGNFSNIFVIPAKAGIQRTLVPSSLPSVGETRPDEIGDGSEGVSHPCHAGAPQSEASGGEGWHSVLSSLFWSFEFLSFVLVSACTE